MGLQGIERNVYGWDQGIGAHTNTKSSDHDDCRTKIVNQEEHEVARRLDSPGFLVDFSALDLSVPYLSVLICWESTEVVNQL